MTARHADASNFDPSEQFNSRRWLERALGALKTEERTLILLFEIEGWSVAELAGLHNKPEGTIKARLWRARRKMRQKLESYIPAPYAKDDNKYWRIESIRKERLRSPVGIALSSQGKIYVADSELNQVIVYDNSGKFQFTIKGYFERPTGLHINNDTLSVVDTFAGKIIGISL